MLERTPTACRLDVEGVVTVVDPLGWLFAILSVVAQLASPGAPLQDAAGMPPPLETALREDLATRLSAGEGEVNIASYRHVTWPDGCLGAYEPGTVCAQVAVDGFVAILLGPDGARYRYHGSGDGFIAVSFIEDAEIGDPLSPQVAGGLDVSPIRVAPENRP